ncbi:uncharacterized protein LOC142320184 [Lycorma delicatula]|uniref:uncharacterized protein LOC142320184 n=1 Tax=Lycorma delicatula TaxID=130591 RepID=UPI003F50F90B
MENKSFVSSLLYLVLAAVILQLCGAHNPCTNNDGQECSRIKRQAQDVGNQLIDNIFKIPITTLTAVSDLIKSTRPVVKEVRRRAQEQYNQYQDNRRKTTVQYIDLRRTSPHPPPRRRSHAASVAGIHERYDGSSYRI